MKVCVNVVFLACVLALPLHTVCRVLLHTDDFTSVDDDVVDLGYQLNQGQIVVSMAEKAVPILIWLLTLPKNETLITFRNVRYAAPPLGSARFQPPAVPPTDRSGVQDHPDVIAPQAYPSWLITGTTGPVTPKDIPPPDPRTSEDCLFLDILQPASIWEARHISKAPVLVWIHGGGFDLGWKDASGRGEGLVLRSPRNGTRGIILVSINYRLGLFVGVPCFDICSSLFG